MAKKIVISTQEQLKQLVEFAIPFLHEEENDEELEAQPADKTKPVETDQEAKRENPNKAAVVADTNDVKKGDITLDMIVTKINQLRSGRSLKDKTIASEMEKWFNELDDNEKLALFAFLKGIVQIITGEIPGKDAIEPEDTKQIDIKGKPMPGETKTLKVPVIHKGGPRTQESLPPGKEDTTAPMPVQAKQR